MTDARQLGSRYQLGEVIGYGGMAEVHRGSDLRLGRDVAVKVLRTDLARDPGFQERFRREAQNAASLNHPSIVAVYDTGEDIASDGVGLPFIVMEFVEGRTLKEVLADEGRLMPERAMEITADVCAALDFSHRNGIVHRDIKPGNVMLNNDGAVKVMDFGIARALAGGTSTMTQTSAVIGTAQYLSPEQARGETVDARSDVYSTGCLLYELLIGHPPFTGDSPVAVAYQHVRENPIPPSQLNPDVGPDVDAIVLKAMAKNAANRYQTAGDMRADLLRAAAGQQVSATPLMTEEERTQLIAPAGGNDDVVPDDQRRRRRRGLIIAGSIVAALAVFAVAAFATMYFLGGDGNKQVPNVVGQTQAAAQSSLTQAGFQIKLAPPDPNAAGTVGTVVKQDPAGLAQAPENSTVTITVKTAPNQVQVPDFSGKSYEEAQTQASGVKLTVTRKEVDSEKPEGEVVGQDKEAGTSVAPNTSIELEVSKGNEVKVPSVVGQSYSDAKSTLEGAGFKVQRSNANTNDPTRNDTVKSQNPSGGSTASKDDTVTLTVYRYEQTQPTTPTPTETDDGGGLPDPTAGPGGNINPRKWDR